MRDKSLRRLYTSLMRSVPKPSMPVIAPCYKWCWEQVKLRCLPHSDRKDSSVWGYVTCHDTEYIHDLIYGIIFRSGRPISRSLWYLRSDSGKSFLWLIERESSRILFLTGLIINNSWPGTCQVWINLIYGSTSHCGHRSINTSTYYLNTKVISSRFIYYYNRW